MSADEDPNDLESAALAAYRSGDLQRAADGFARSREVYAAGDDVVKAAEMGNNLCVVLLGLDRAREALEAVEGTGQVFEEAGLGLQAARAAGNRAAALAACGRMQPAIDGYQDAIRRFHALGARSEEADTLQALSRLQLQGGDPMAAAATAQVALDVHPSPGPIRRLARSIINRAFGLLRG
ncbi:MAG TPA: hypothetical protein VLL77_10750 [Anaerolineales bacterium]|nr:hypothetical protein [Anaerolineales bacterium]